VLDHFDSVVFFVEDINAAANWYAKILDTQVQYENPSYAFIEFSGGKIGFHPADKLSHSGISGQTSYWKVEKLSIAIELFTKNGAKLYRGPMKTDLNEHVCILQDPFSSTIGLISHSS